jgi:hypothetical protein
VKEDRDGGSEARSPPDNRRRPNYFLLAAFFAGFFAAFLAGFFFAVLRAALANVVLLIRSEPNRLKNILVQLAR